MEKNGTIQKTMVLYRKLWNFDLPQNKLWYYGKNYGTMKKKLWYYTENCGTLINYGKKLWYYGKKLWNYSKLQ